MAHCWNGVAPSTGELGESPCVAAYLCVTVSRGVSQVCQRVSSVGGSSGMGIACSWCSVGVPALRGPVSGTTECTHTTTFCNTVYFWGGGRGSEELGLQII